MANGKFEARELAFKINANEFVVDCGQTGVLAADVDCTQQTVRTLAVTLDDENLLLLQKALQKALDEIKGLSPTRA